MNKVDARSISVYTRQIVGLAATYEIRSIAVCAFMLFYDGYKVEATLIYTSIYHSGKLQSPWHFPIWDLFSSFFPLVFSLFHSFSRFFLSFPCLSKTHRIALFSTTGNTKTKISQCHPLRCPKRDFHVVSALYCLLS